MDPEGNPGNVKATLTAIEEVKIASEIAHSHDNESMCIVLDAGKINHILNMAEAPVVITNHKLAVVTNTKDKINPEDAEVVDPDCAGIMWTAITAVGTKSNFSMGVVPIVCNHPR